MPSLFSKFRHRKSASQSSASSIGDQPSSPRQSLTTSSDTPPRIRNSLDQSQSRHQTPTESHSHSQSQSQYTDRRASHPNPASSNVPTTRTEDDVVVIEGNNNNGGSGRDSKGHSKPFNDESDRPELPTTSSNVNNPIPVSPPSHDLAGLRSGTGSGSGSGSASGYSTTTSYIPKEDLEDNIHKPLPSVPEVQSPPVQSNDLRAFPLPPNSASSLQPHAHGQGHGQGHGGQQYGYDNDSEPYIPPKSPQRNSISEHPHGHGQDRVRSPPLPHVSSVDRSNILRDEEERPGLVGSSSRPPRIGEDVIGNYPHISNIPYLNDNNETQQESQSNREYGSNTGGYNANQLDVRQSGSGISSGTNQTQSQGQGQSQVGYQNRKYDLNTLKQTVLGSGVGGLDWNKPSSTLDPNSSTTSDSGLQRRFNDLSLGQSEHLGDIHEQRNEMVSRLTEETQLKASKRSELTQQGKDVFHKAGMGKLLGTEDSIDIASKTLEPVVQEIIYPVEHTEYTTIITRCVHKTHYIPLIQPIHDPNPIILQTRHRIFDSTTGKWHEVIGDAAAVSILGEDVFRNGHKEVRELRKPALPGLEVMDEDAIRMAREAGVGRADLTKGYKYEGSQQDDIPIRGKDVSQDGIGLGGGQGRVLEREYQLGSEKKSDWKEIATYVGIGTKNKQDDQVGLAM
ncbi:uncharacterized protein IL334_001284 [Kwoniella shivajii]|uniref:Uncharacterized protein n=1 Tax=Kwoniella shivajii TaxID=564305 RepID=A0ABZ1CSM5_9TREE|nr:hypothetical protein IL334_001284 [Kwoniella shivajii]